MIHFRTKHVIMNFWCMYFKHYSRPLHLNITYDATEKVVTSCGYNDEVVLGELAPSHRRAVGLWHRGWKSWNLWCSHDTVLNVSNTPYICLQSTWYLYVNASFIHLFIQFINSSMSFFGCKRVSILLDKYFRTLFQFLFLLLCVQLVYQS